MFGTEHVNAATKWLRSSIGRKIEITYAPDSGYMVNLSDNGAGVAMGNDQDLMDALKQALKGLPQS